MGFWFSFSNIVGYGADFHANTALGRFITAGLYLLSLTLVASCTANLASNLTISKSNDIVSRLDDLKNGKVLYSHIRIYVGTSMEDIYLNEISKGKRNFYRIQTSEQMYNALLAEIIDVRIVDSGEGEYVSNNIRCSLTLVGTDFYAVEMGIVMPEQS
ncbi:unnamed protein product [Adineta steineri]|uniref:Ionotropic glutamate receptor C-terminal domain-containing protein n=1 Tax=Adineta steineri TaxID=433720 RepID=A0A818NVT1_9BILA|nr:unnamed protein product [Adineta steineri]CAF3613761.1 unnamed protein product [Adineta steineri]